MANVKFTEFPSAATVGGTDIIPIVQGGVNKKATGAVFSTYIGSAFVALTGNQTIAGFKTFSSQLISSVADGTAPFSVASTTKVTNLNADLLDGLSSAAFQTVLTNPITGTGTTNYLPKFTGASALGNSTIFDNGNVGIGTTSPTHLLTLNQTASGGTYFGLYQSYVDGNDWRNWAIGTNDQAFGDFVIKQSNATGGNPNSAGTIRLYIPKSGNVLIGTTTDVASSKLTIESTTQGVLVPRMTTTQINAIGSPANGLIAYNTTLATLCFYDGSGWRKVSHSAM